MTLDFNCNKIALRKTRNIIIKEYKLHDSFITLNILEQLVERGDLGSIVYLEHIKFGKGLAHARFVKQYAGRFMSSSNLPVIIRTYSDMQLFDEDFINSIMDCYNKYKAVKPVDPVQLKSLMSPLDESYGELLLSHISNLKSQLQKARYELDKLNSK